MGKELPLARKEEEGQPVLLAITSFGELIATVHDRNERKKKLTSAKRYGRGKAKNTKTKSKSSIKTKGTNASSVEKERRGRDNKNR